MILAIIRNQEGRSLQTLATLPHVLFPAIKLEECHPIQALIRFLNDLVLLMFPFMCQVHDGLLIF